MNLKKYLESMVKRRTAGTVEVKDNACGTKYLEVDKELDNINIKPRLSPEEHHMLYLAAQDLYMKVVASDSTQMRKNGPVK